jgi:hypothetical protein
MNSYSEDMDNVPYSRSIAKVLACWGWTRPANLADIKEWLENHDPTGLDIILRTLRKCSSDELSAILWTANKQHFVNPSQHIDMILSLDTSGELQKKFDSQSH